MKVRTRLVIAFVVIGAVSMYALISWLADDLRLRYQASMEETMVDVANVLAAIVEREIAEGDPLAAAIRHAFEQASDRNVGARIYEHIKDDVNMIVYVTDDDGTVVYHSSDPDAIGTDYSRWNDVVRTMRGEYGARATRRNPEDPMTAVLYVAAPIRVNGEISGVLSVGKPADSVETFLLAARNELIFGGLMAAMAVIVLGLAVSFWITRPIELLTGYARSVRDGVGTTAPKLGHSDIGELGNAFEEMRVALEGKQYVENYVQSLTHQMKSPIAGIRAAAELLDEDMPKERRQQFLENIRTETGRMGDLVDRMLELAAIENRRQLTDAEQIDLSQLAETVAETQQNGVNIVIQNEAKNPCTVVGERFLLQQAIANLIQNAIDFSRADGEVRVAISQTADAVIITVEDNGEGIPGYALPKVFDRFYSLPRPGTDKKSSGIGLSFVREVAELHRGSATITNRPDGGAQATLSLPLHVPT